MKELEKLRVQQTKYMISSEKNYIVIRNDGC